MSFADDLDAREVETTIADLLAQLKDVDRAALLRALTDLQTFRSDGQPRYRWSETALAKRLGEEGWKVSTWQVRRWRQANVAE